MKLYLNTSKISNNLKIKEGTFTYSKYAVHKPIFKNYSPKQCTILHYISQTPLAEYYMSRYSNLALANIFSSCFPYLQG